MENEKQMIKSHPRFLTPKRLVEEQTFLTMGGLRHWLFYSCQNGLEKALVRIGKRKILISEEGFFDWLKEQNCKGGK